MASQQEGKKERERVCWTCQELVEVVGHRTSRCPFQVCRGCEQKGHSLKHCPIRLMALVPQPNAPPPATVSTAPSVPSVAAPAVQKPAPMMFNLPKPVPCTSKPLMATANNENQDQNAQQVASRMSAEHRENFERQQNDLMQKLMEFKAKKKSAPSNPSSNASMSPARSRNSSSSDVIRSVISPPINEHQFSFQQQPTNESLPSPIPGCSELQQQRRSKSPTAENNRIIEERRIISIDSDRSPSPPPSRSLNCQVSGNVSKDQHDQNLDLGPCDSTTTKPAVPDILDVDMKVYQKAFEMSQIRKRAEQETGSSSGHTSKQLQKLKMYEAAIKAKIKAKVKKKMKKKMMESREADTEENSVRQPKKSKENYRKQSTTDSSSSDSDDHKSKKKGQRSRSKRRRPFRSSSVQSDSGSTLKKRNRRKARKRSRRSSSSDSSDSSSSTSRSEQDKKSRSRSYRSKDRSSRDHEGKQSRSRRHYSSSSTSRSRSRSRSKARKDPRQSATRRSRSRSSNRRRRRYSKSRSRSRSKSRSRSRSHAPKTNNDLAPHKRIRTVTSPKEKRVGILEDTVPITSSNSNSSPSLVAISSPEVRSRPTRKERQKSGASNLSFSLSDGEGSLSPEPKMNTDTSAKIDELFKAEWNKVLETRRNSLDRADNNYTKSAHSCPKDLELCPVCPTFRLNSNYATTEPKDLQVGDTFFVQMHVDLSIEAANLADKQRATVKVFEANEPDYLKKHFEIVPDTYAFESSIKVKLRLRKRPARFWPRNSVFAKMTVAQFDQKTTDLIRGIPEDALVSVDKFEEGEFIMISPGKTTSLRMRLRQVSRFKDGDKVKLTPLERDLKLLDTSVTVSLNQKFHSLMFEVLVTNQGHKVCRLQNGTVLAAVEEQAKTNSRRHSCQEHPEQLCQGCLKIRFCGTHNVVHPGKLIEGKYFSVKVKHELSNQVFLWAQENRPKFRFFNNDENGVDPHFEVCQRNAPFVNQFNLVSFRVLKTPTVPILESDLANLIIGQFDINRDNVNELDNIPEDCLVTLPVDMNAYRIDANKDFLLKLKLRKTTKFKSGDKITIESKLEDNYKILDKFAEVGFCKETKRLRAFVNVRNMWNQQVILKSEQVFGYARYYEKN